MTDNFTWVEIYHELAKTLLGWQNRQPELIAFLEELRAKGYVISSLQDKNRDDERFLLREIDPFTFMGVFNRGIRDEQRVVILTQIKQFFQLKSPVPTDFAGVPVLNNMKSWFFPYQALREAGHISRLWHILQLALREKPPQDPLFLRIFDEALATRVVNINLTMGLFWVRPDTFLSLDSRNRAYLGIEMPKGGLNSKFYAKTLGEVAARGKSFPQLSSDAWLSGWPSEISPEPASSLAIQQNRGYWLVGAYWDDRSPADQTQRFIEEGIWENGDGDRYLSEVRQMKVNDKIAIKAATTQRKNLPFDGQGRTISRIIIKAVGTIIANRDDGRSIEVEWEPDFQEKSWYFFTNRNTVWHLRIDDSYKFKNHTLRLIDFVWHGGVQDYAWYINEWWGTQKPGGQNPPLEGVDIGKPPYSLEDLIASGVFLEEDELNLILNRLHAKKAMILQGPPGVGKTFIARKLAYALMEEIDDERIEMVQFHQSYAYDDFVRGYRPQPGQAGSFALQDGIFYDFCQKARNDPDHSYVFVIDEINRGNLSQIFGELLMLIESDKRGPEFAVPLVYRKPEEARFYIPFNLYLIGLMNVADRSLAMVDYALRRRFAFINLKPQFESESFRRWLIERSMEPQLVQRIIEKMSILNRAIREDPLLGENYQIGHSYFCPKGDNFNGLDPAWYESIVRTEIVPMLQEYWFDNAKKAEEITKGLIA